MPKYTIVIDVSPSEQVALEDSMPEIIEMGWPISIKNSAKVLDIDAKITKIVRHAEKERIWEA